MKGLLIALGIAAGATTAYIVKKINDILIINLKYIYF